MVIQLLIELNAEGKVDVTGPLDNKAVCYFLLEEAKDAIKDFHQKKRVIPASGVVMMPPPPNGR